jgi:hypothetical protein
VQSPWQEAEEEPVLLSYLPAGHEMQLVFPCWSWYSPRGQLAQALDPTKGEYVPFKQSSQLLALLAVGLY